MNMFTAGDITPLSVYIEDDNLPSPGTALVDAISMLINQRVGGVPTSTIGATSTSTVTSYLIFLVLNFPKYDAKVYEPEEYIEEFKSECNVYRHDDVTKRHLLGHAIREAKGKHLPWFIKEGTTIQDYKAFKKTFLEANRMTGRAAVIQSAKKQLCKHNHARESAGYLKVEDHEVVEQWIDGLTKEQMQDYVAMKDPEGFEEAKKHSLEYKKRVYCKYQKGTSDDSEDNSSEPEEETEVVVTEKTAGKTTKTNTTTKNSPDEVHKIKWVKEVKKQIAELKNAQQPLDKKNDELTSSFRKLSINMAEMRSVVTSMACLIGYGTMNNLNNGGGINRQISEITCFKCQQKVHYASDCKNDPKCQHCGGKHLSREHRLFQQSATIKLLAEEERLGTRQVFSRSSVRVTDESMRLPQCGTQDARVMAATRLREERKEKRLHPYKDKREEKREKTVTIHEPPVIGVLLTFAVLKNETPKKFIDDTQPQQISKDRFAKIDIPLLSRQKSSIIDATATMIEPMEIDTGTAKPAADIKVTENLSGGHDEKKKREPVMDADWLRKNRKKL
ncbi:hypothetical protein HK097_007921 [Rhizophlyctis rosea]|uniref:CCHC-type domain-containing protein n=1 Tax=Rhizophlyctis rosea TaxID=64517 RepID=A0AAD5SDV3_9FUNG|nr:hypothetical protein HK097_007921 [Rhizophlyctis rosea]